MTLKETIKLKVYNFVTSIKTAACVIGSALIIFSALRNSLTWHMQHFWGGSHNFWQNQWKTILEYTGGNEFLLFVIGPWLASLVPFWIFNTPFIVMDMTKKPAFLYKYKIQDEKNTQVTWAKVKHTALMVLRNQLLNIPFLICLLPLYKWRDMMSYGPELPTFQRVLVELMVFVFVEEILFYYTHRILHHPAIYKHVHKIHHEWTTPISITSLYSHPFESLFSNFLPLFIGPLIYGSHLATTYLWVLIATLNTTNAHCGYHFPIFPSNEAHDYHHLKFNEMFGVLGILDRLHNTDAKFRTLKQYERHQTYFTLTPIKQVIPDPPQKSREISGAQGTSKNQ